MIGWLFALSTAVILLLVSAIVVAAGIGFIIMLYDHNDRYKKKIRDLQEQMEDKSE